jgi:Tfp pilus assembly protein PilF
MSTSQAPTASPEQLVAQGIAAYKSGDTAQARSLLIEALQFDPNLEAAWLWLSGVVADDAERRY